MTRATVVALCLGVSAVAGAQPKPWISTPVSGQITFVADSGRKTIRIPIVLDTGIAKVNAAIEAVQFGNRFDLSIADAFQAPTVVPKTSASGAAILLTVLLDKLPGAGTYTVIIAATAAKREPQRMTLQVVAPAARLRPVAALTFRRVLSPTTEAESVRITIADTSGMSRLTHVRVLPAGSFSSDSLSVMGTVQADDVATRILAPRDTLSVWLRATGDFPLGTSRGSVEVSAPELAQPVSVPVEVRTRRTYLWIFAAMVAGILAGWTGRTEMERRAEKARATLALADARALIEAEKRLGDTEFRQALETVSNSLTQAETLDTQAQVTAVIAQATTALDAARAALDTRIAAATVEIDVLDQTLDVPWAGNALGNTAPQLRNQSAVARAGLSRGDLTAARASIDAMRAAMATDVGRAATDWVRRANVVVVDLKTMAEGVPAAITNSLTATDAERTKEVADIQGQIPTHATPDLLRLATAIVKANAGYTNVYHGIRLWLAKSVDDAVAILETVELPAADKLTLLRDAARSLDVELEQRERNPVGDHDQKATSDAAALLESAWNNALISQLVGATTQAQGDVKTFLAQRNFVEAARAVARAREDLARAAAAAAAAVTTSDGGVTQKIETALGKQKRKAGREDTDRGITSPIAPWRILFGRSAAEAPAATTRVVYASAPRPPLTAQAMRKRSFRELALARGIQTILFAPVVGAVGFTIFAKNYVGTWTDLLAAFLWAFTLDFSLNTVTDLAKKPRA